MIYHCHVMNYEIDTDTAEEAAHIMRDLLQGEWPVVTVTKEEVDPPDNAVDIDTEQFYPLRDD